MAEAVDEERTAINILGLGEADRHLVDAGPAGPRWHAKTPAFSILVHSPSKRTSGITGAYTMYSVTSLFPALLNQTVVDWVQVDDPDDVYPPSPNPNGETGTRITVQRRFSQFVMLHTVLSRRLPGIVLPPLPEKQYAGRFSEDFVEARRGDLERYLNKVVRHPVVRYAEILMFFLGCESDSVSTIFCASEHLPNLTPSLRNGLASCLSISRHLLLAHHSMLVFIILHLMSTRKMPRRQ